VFPTLSFGDQEFTPQEMSTRSAQVAGAMAAIGLKEGDTIALMLRNEPALMDIMLAARQLGLYFTPLNWHFKSERQDTLCAIAVRKRCSHTLTYFSKLGTVSHLMFPSLRSNHIHSPWLLITYKNRQD
jgi:acyl-CoA synthetase (AMP-forming)/AMP-acid ligase II